MMPIAIYPVIALGTLGLKQCNTGINARMSSAQYSVRSMSIGTMSVGGGKCDWRATNFNPKLLEKNFEKHKDGWGGNMISASMYEKRAQRLLNSRIGGDIEGFTSKEGFVFRYNKRTNEFADAKPNGIVETLFRPKNGYKYWQTQIDKYKGD